MKNIFIKRLTAYAIDFILISLLTAAFIGNVKTNPNYNKHNDLYNEYTNTSLIYTNFIGDFSKSILDNKLTEDEYLNIIKRNSSGDYAFKYELDIAISDNDFNQDELKSIKDEYTNLGSLLDKYYDNGLSITNYNNLVDELTIPDDINNQLCDQVKSLIGETDKKIIDEQYEKIFFNYTKKVNEYNYKLSKLNIYADIYMIVIYILYFGVFVYIVDGISFGKKLMKLQIVKKDGSKVGLGCMLLRAIILTNIEFTLLNIFGVYTFSQGIFTMISYASTLLSGLMEILMISFASFRKDGRGLHDLICNTKVISTKEDLDVKTV